ncbi:Glutamyl-tRNA(Gln) amidotransferase subunit A [Fusarium oxysporum f. sp. rapae]|uniref:Glutamyl-tRNA(Gln) amidotransferase subunit A n=1 Tax=Fusarium oxysporum f. sp. rapae TaxID=485398 RepID=A0A8J5P2G5_FUSOX|nr:Glutamyl-tRNA(Gln) amidotransferase subunit A [Fusarium oxysporum f. sp. rapae]
MPHIFWVLAFFLAVAGSGIWPWSYNEAIYPLSDGVELWKLTASEALGKIQADEMSVREYAESLLERIKARDEDVKAWAYLDEKRVMQEARHMPTQFNSPLYDGHFPETDAASVRILRHAGALIFGKTTTTEFAAIHVGPKTHNPHDPLRTPGGSSSGSGAAVADFQAPMALGTQTGGSMIRPASFNGIYGFKPTWNSVSREGQKIYALMYDTLGWYARCVEDLILLADVFALQDDDDEDHSFQGISGARFAICKTSIWPEAGPGTKDALARAADLLRSHGAEVHELELPSAFDDVPEWYRIGLHTEGRTSFLPEYRVGKDQIGQVLIEHVENSDNFTRKTQLMASDSLAAMRPVFDFIASQYAAIITPSVPDEAPVGLENTGSHVFCAMWSGLHVPVLNVPGFKGDHGMPVGLSLVAPRYRDRHLLKVSKAVGEIFEAEGGWKTRVD